MDMDIFYQAFEARFRGSRDEIKGRQGVYLPLVEYVAPSDAHPVLDIGFGRGEWLELLRDRGIPAIGIDINARFVGVATAAGFNVQEQDAVRFLGEEPEGKYSLISAFHVVEHVNFDVLVDMLESILRALKPGGAVLLETPNPMNVQVGINNFYLDPTHVRPLPSLLLSFAAEYLGFERVAVVKVNGGASGTDLYEAPDYAVVAFKAPAESAGECVALIETAIQARAKEAAPALARDALQLIQGAVGAEHESKAARLKMLELRGERDVFREKVNQQALLLLADQSRISALESALDKLQDTIRREIEVEHAVLAEEQHVQTQLREEINRVNGQLAAVYASTSWQVTRPLRLAGRAATALAAPRQTSKKAAKAGLRRLVRGVQAQVWLRPCLNAAANRFPVLWGSLLTSVRGAMSDASPPMRKDAPLELGEDARRFKALLIEQLARKNANVNSGWRQK